MADIVVTDRITDAILKLMLLGCTNQQIGQFLEQIASAIEQGHNTMHLSYMPRVKDRSTPTS